jgi:hypothetical protein
MSKHTPLPSDPVAKAAEKKRRFAVYRRGWRQRRREARKEAKIAYALGKLKLQRAARQLCIDLCLDLQDLTPKQLSAAIRTAEGWRSET